jgi:hypothetical protein
MSKVLSVCGIRVQRQTDASTARTADEDFSLVQQRTNIARNSLKIENGECVVEVDGLSTNRTEEDDQEEVLV